MERSLLGKLMALLLLPLLWPTVALAADSRGIGIVTTLEGQAVVTRAALSQQPLPLKFRDSVFFKDRISTEEHSIVRVLLKDKAAVTVRELSTLTITDAEERGRASVLDMLNGKVSLAVARLRMAPEKSIEIRTPNAVVSVRGTFLVVEVIPAPSAQLSTGQAAVITHIYLLEGSVEVFTRRAPRTPIPVGAFQSVTIIGDVAGPVHPIPASAVAGILRDLTPKLQHTETPDEAKQVISDKEQAKGRAIAQVLGARLDPQGTREQGLSKAELDAASAFLSDAGVINSGLPGGQTLQTLMGTPFTSTVTNPLVTLGPLSGPNLPTGPGPTALPNLIQPPNIPTTGRCITQTIAGKVIQVCF